jgi:hypothetical protein
MPPFSSLSSLRARPTAGRPSLKDIRPTASQPRGWRAASGHCTEAR